MHYLQKAHLSSDTKLIDLADINIYDASVHTDEAKLSSFTPSKQLKTSVICEYTGGLHIQLVNAAQISSEN